MVRLATGGPGIQGLDPVHAPGCMKFGERSVHRGRGSNALIAKVFQYLVGREWSVLPLHVSEHPVRMRKAS